SALKNSSSPDAARLCAGTRHLRRAGHGLLLCRPAFPRWLAGSARNSAHPGLRRRRHPSDYRTSSCPRSGYDRLVASLARRSFRIMFFPISQAHVNPIYLFVVGFVIGILGGFLGVGGSFIAGPALGLAGIDWNFAVGTDLAQIVGRDVVGVERHGYLCDLELSFG